MARRGVIRAPLRPGRGLVQTSAAYQAGERRLFSVMTAIAQPVRLSARERDVLELLADGYSTRAVAHRLFYSERTVKNIVHRLMTRWELRNRTQTVVVAARNGWI
jgi:DNA-binding NarL/FixJ family response regulator